MLLEELLTPRGGGVVHEGERSDDILLRRGVVHAEYQETPSSMASVGAPEAPAYLQKITTNLRKQ